MMRRQHRFIRSCDPGRRISGYDERVTKVYINLHALMIPFDPLIIKYALFHAQFLYSFGVIPYIFLKC